MSAKNEDAVHLLLARQNPETGAQQLRELSRAELHLWQEIGRKGTSVSDLEIRHVGRDIQQEVRDLVEYGVVHLQALSKASGNEDKTVPEEPEDDPRVRGSSSTGNRRRRRTTGAIERSNLETTRDEAMPALHLEKLEIDDTEETYAVPPKTRPKRVTAAVEKSLEEKPARRKAPTAIPEIKAIEDKTKKMLPVPEAQPPQLPTAATERPTERGLQAPPQDKTAPASTGARRAQRPTAAIEKPVRRSRRRTKRKATPAPVEHHAMESREDTGAPAKVGATRTLENWATEDKVPSAAGATPVLDSGALGDWAARGTQAATRPSMVNRLSPVERIPLPDVAGEKRPTGLDKISLPPMPAESVGQLHSDAVLARGLQTGNSPNGNRGLRTGNGPTRNKGLQTGNSPTEGATALELGGDLTGEERELMKLEVDLSMEEKRRVLDVTRAVKSGDICGLLRLPNTADRKEIKRAYFALSQELHPDQYFGRNLGGFKLMLEQAFTSLAQYVKALSDKRTTLPNSYRTSNQSRRTSRRFHVSLRAQVQCDSWSGPEWTMTQDISSGGAFLITECAAKVGDGIRLNVESVNGTIGIIGKVVSLREADQARRERRNAGFGIQFENAAEVDSQRLSALLEEVERVTPAFTGSMPIKSADAVRLSKRGKIHKKKLIIGIDLGTTNTAVSAVVDNRVQIVPWPDGSYALPSVVGFPERGRCIVGYEAQAHLLTDPRNVINSGKRLMGRQFDDPEIASFMAEARFKNYKGPDGTVIAQLWGEDYAIPQICSYLFEAAKHAAERALGAEPTKTVLTVPVSFDKLQIESMRRAAKLAQLDVVEVIEEPCAAAIANQGQKDFKGIVGVYDFGGGTFDFSLVEAGTGDLRVLATTGDSWLGGDDFDLAIADAAANMFWKAEGTDLREKAVEWQHLIYACEKAKRELSTNEHAHVVVPEVARNAQGPVDLRINLARNKVELLWAEPIRRSLDTCKQALSLAGIPMSRLSAIYMSGGTSYIPAIRRSLMKSFGVPVHLGIAPEHAVCAGAGIRAAILQGQ